MSDLERELAHVLAPVAAPASLVLGRRAKPKAEPVRWLFVPALVLVLLTIAVGSAWKTIQPRPVKALERPAVQRVRTYASASESCPMCHTL